MARLSMDLRISILRKIYDELSEGRDEEARERRTELAHTLRNAIIKPYLREFDTIPENWFCTSEFINVHVNSKRRNEEAEVIDEDVADGYYGYRQSKTYKWRGCLLSAGFNYAYATENLITFPIPKDLAAFLSPGSAGLLRSGKFVPGNHTSLEYGNRLRVPWFANKSVEVDEIPEPVLDQIITYASECYEKNSQMKKVLVNSFNVLESCNTTKQLIAKWSEVERFIPADNEIVTRSPRSRRQTPNPDAGANIDVKELTEDLQDLL